MEKSATYANKLSVAINQQEASILFQWMVPEYDKSGKIIGDDIAYEQIVTMPTQLIINLRDILNTITKEQHNGTSAE